MTTRFMAQNSIIHVYTCVLHFVVLMSSVLDNVCSDKGRLFHEILFLDIFLRY